MPNFEIYGKYRIKKDIFTVNMIARLLQDNLAQYYSLGNIKIIPSGILLKGNLKAFFERAITKAEIQIKLEGNQLIYRVRGKSSLGAWSWVWFFSGFIFQFFFFWFAFDLVLFMISRDRPKKYFEDAFKAMQFELGAG